MPMGTKIAIVWKRGTASGKGCLKLKANNPSAKQIQEALRAYREIPKNRGKVVELAPVPKK